MKPMKKENGIYLNKKYCTVFMVLAVVFIAYVLPIILADRYYNDDLARSLSGATGWNGDGRPVTEYLLRLLCNGMPIGDISPFPLLISVLLLAYTLTVYARKKFSEFELSFTLIGALFLVIANPFLLANLSYKYDNVTMVGSLCLVFIPYLLPEKISWWKRLVMVFLVSLISLSSYQVVAGALLGLLLLDVFFDLLKGKMNWEKPIVTAIGFSFGGVIYKLVVAKHFVDKTGWREEASHFVSGMTMESLREIVSNLAEVKKLVMTEFLGIPKTIIAIAIFGVVVSLVWMVHLIWNIWTSKQTWKRVIAVVFVILLPLLLAIASVAPFIVLQNLSVRSRMMISVSIPLLYIGILLLFLSKRFPRIVTCLLIPCIFFCFSYSYSYGNALKSQKNYETYLAYEIVHDIETINAEEIYTNLSIVGQTPKSQQLQMLCKKYPQFNELVGVYISNSAWIGGSWLHHYMQQNIPFRELSEDEKAVLVELKPIDSNMIYNSYVCEDTIVIQFR